jgi:hypothetical protein
MLYCCQLVCRYLLLLLMVKLFVAPLLPHLGGQWEAAAIYRGI